jgi:hypothetical protein
MTISLAFLAPELVKARSKDDFLMASVSLGCANAPADWSRQ